MTTFSNGDRVRLTRDLRSRVGLIPAGTEGTFRTAVTTASYAPSAAVVDFPGRGNVVVAVSRLERVSGDFDCCQDLAKRAAEAKRAVTEKAVDESRAGELARAHCRVADALMEVAAAQRALAAIEARPF